MIQQKINHRIQSAYIEALFHRVLSINIIAGVFSVALLISLCKIAYADESIQNTDGFKLGGYASASASLPDDSSAEAMIDDVSLMLSWQNEGRFQFFGELELERPLTWNEDSRFNSKDLYFDLERLYLDYNLSEKINIRTGRFLTPAGRWNVLHASPLVWTTTRPLVTRYLFPAAVNGLMLYGAMPYQDQAFEYSFFIEALKDQVQDSHEAQFKNVAGARLTLSSNLNLGLTLATFTEENPVSQHYRMIGLDFNTHYKGWELSGEGFQRLTSNGSDGGNGAYLQSAAPLGGNWYWLTRIESFNHPHETSGERWVLGLTKRINSGQLLKMEFVGGSNNLPDAPRGFVGSFAILF